MASPCPSAGIYGVYPTGDFFHIAHTHPLGGVDVRGLGSATCTCT